MADLDADDREKIPTNEFGLPEKARTKEAKKQSGNYPMPDKAHARNAKSRAAQAQNAVIQVGLLLDEVRRADNANNIAFANAAKALQENALKRSALLVAFGQRRGACLSGRYA